MDPDQRLPVEIAQSKRRRIPWFLIIIGVILLMFGAVHLVEKLRGRNQWEIYKAELIAAGEKLDSADYRAAEVADEENFAATPFLKAVLYRDKVDEAVWAAVADIQVGEWVKLYEGPAFTDLKGCREVLRIKHAEVLPDDRPANPAEDILAFIEVAQEPMNELRQAATRSHAQFPVTKSPFMWPRLSFPNTRQLAFVFSMHASASLAVSNSATALEDIRVLHQLGRAYQAGAPVLAENMIGNALYGLELQVIWEGLALQRWSREELKAIQASLESTDLIAAFDKSWRGGERNQIIAVVERTRRNGRTSELLQLLMRSGVRADLVGSIQSSLINTLVPAGWLDMNLYHYVQLMQTGTTAWDVQGHRIYSENFETFNRDMQAAVGETPHNPYYLLTAVAIPNAIAIVKAVGRNQTYAEQASIACALERYFLDRGSYPETLAELVPEYTAKIPHDIVTGAPMGYRREEGRYLLYCTGPDGRDDGGKTIATALRGKGSPEPHGDWVWSYAEPSK